MDKENSQFSHYRLQERHLAGYALWLDLIERTGCIPPGSRAGGFESRESGDLPKET